MRLYAVTEGYSGSDLAELARNAMMGVLREAMRTGDGKRLRPLRTADMEAARTLVEHATPSQ